MHFSESDFEKMMSATEEQKPLSYSELRAEEYRAKLAAKLAVLSDAIQRGADLNRTPEILLADGIEQGGFEPHSWEQKVRFRCSKLSALLTKARSGNDLSETAKTACEETFAELFYGYAPQPKKLPDSLAHGIATEWFCIERAALMLGIELEKNAERKTAGLLTGEADAILAEAAKNGQKIIYEFKSATSPASFVKQAAELKKEYYWQAQGYMKLWGADVVILCTNLVEADYMNGDEYGAVPVPHKQHLRAIPRDETAQKQIDEALQIAYAYTLEFGRKFLQSFSE